MLTMMASASQLEAPGTSVRHRRGLAVALLAADGAGKTTVAHRLRDSLPVPVKMIYMGLYQGSRRSVFDVPVVGLALRLLRAWFRYGVGSVHRARGRIVVFDRYTYDVLVSQTDRLNLLGRGAVGFSAVRVLLPI